MKDDGVLGNQLTASSTHALTADIDTDRISAPSAEMRRHSAPAALPQAAHPIPVPVDGSARFRATADRTPTSFGHSDLDRHTFDRTAVPDLPGGVVRRPRLFRLLTDALDHPVVTVTGPAGWGKTQFLASWVRSPHCSVRTAWLTVERSDTDPQLFWPAVMEAVSRARNNDGSTERRVDSAAPVVEALLGVEDPLLIILDEVHLLQGSAVAADLARLIQMLPPLVRLVLSGQYLPDLPMSKLRIEGKVVAITGKELAFTTAEAEAMLAESGVDVPSRTAVELRDRTEGWSAGLRLAALSLADGIPADDLLDEFGGDHADVADYLISEVLSRLPADVEDFLVRTSVCDRLTGSLAAALTGRSDSANLLRWMARHNVFATTDGPRQTWFRYHTMFGELLRSRLDNLGVAAVRRLHMTASSWLAAHDMPIEAFDQAVRAEHWGPAAAILMDAWPAMYLDGKLVALGERIDLLPADVAAASGLDHVRTAVGLALGDAYWSPGEGDLAGAGFDLYTRLPHALPLNSRPLPDRPGPTATGEESAAWAEHAATTLPVLVVDLERARLSGDLDGAARVAQRLVALSASDDLRSTWKAPDLRALAYHHLGVTEYWAGRKGAAEAHLREALAEATGGGRAYMRLGCLAQLVLVLTVQNRLTEAMRECDAAVALVEAESLEFTGAAAELWHALGWVAYLRGDFDLAEKHLAGAALAVRRQDAAVAATVLLVQGMTAATRGRKRDALALLDEADRVMARLRARYVFDDYVTGERVRTRLAIGDIDGARTILASCYEGPHGPVHLSIAQAELLISEGRPTQATDLLERASKTGHGLDDQHLQALVLLALLQEGNGDDKRAVDTLSGAVSLAAPEGYIQPFLQFGRRSSQLLRKLQRSRRTHTALIDEILASADTLQSEGESPRPPRAEGLEQMPTERELEVLRSLDSLASLPEISATMFVSVNTLKGHLRNLYRKLGVASRREAVARGRSLGLM